MCHPLEDKVNTQNFFWCLQNEPAWALEAIRKNARILLNRQPSEAVPFHHVILSKNGTLILCYRALNHFCVKCIMYSGCALHTAMEA